MFDEERDDLPQEPEATPPEATPPEEDTPAAAPDESAEATSEAALPESDAEEVGPEIEGAEELAAAAAAEPQQERRPRPGTGERTAGEDEVIPGMHLEPDLVLEEAAREESEFGAYGEDGSDSDSEAPEAAGDETPSEPEVVALTPLDLAADARYRATGKRKRAVARVILKPGEGTYSVNGRHLDEYFPRVRLQRMATQPLDATGNSSRMDVVARIHGGGVSAQATALRHGIARALVEADPALRSELKRRGYLTRDPRVKERKKAGLKKARKRPQFSKR